MLLICFSNCEAVIFPSRNSFITRYIFFDLLSKDGTISFSACLKLHSIFVLGLFLATGSLAYSEGNVEIPLWQMFDHELTIYNSKWLTNEDLQSVVDLISAGKINTEKMISLKTDFAHYPEAVEKIGRGDVIKIIITP